MTRSSWSRLLAAGIVGLGVGFGLAQSANHMLRNEQIPVTAAATRAGQVSEQVREILAIGDRLQRLAELAALLRGLSPEAVPAVQHAFDSAALDRGDPELIQLAIWWAGFDPEAAYRWTSSDWRGADGFVLGAIFRTWAGHEPEKAWRTAQTISFRGHREFCMDSVITGWDEAGRPGLIEFVRALPAGPARQRAADILARRRVVALGADGALAWIMSLPPGEFRDLMTPRITSAVTIADPSLAASWAGPQIASATRPTGLPRRIATRWILRDPNAAMAWLASLPAGNDRDDGVTEAFRDWLRRDPLAARAWIESADMERWNEPAFGQFARGAIAQADPRRALEIVGRLSDDSLRNYLTTVIARGWLQRDREAADAWIRQAELPEVVRERAYMISKQEPRAPRNPPGADPLSSGEPPGAPNR